MIREQRKKKKRGRAGLVLFLIIILLIMMGILIIWNVFTVEQVIVEGNELYSSEQIENLVLNDEHSWNSLYVEMKYRFIDTEEVPFVDAMEVSLTDPHTVKIKVYEKGILGCFYIDSIGQYAYFDKDGFVVETSSEVIEDVPKITGISCSEVVLYEKLPLEDDKLLKNLLELTQTLNKYHLEPQEIHYTADMKPELTYDGVQVVVGSGDNLSQKIVRLSNILPQLSGMHGTLHLDKWTPDTTDIVFDKEKETNP